MIDYKKFTEKSIGFLAEYIKTNNLKSLVLGVSGGIDSTITAIIASEACKKCEIPLIGRSLPSCSNSPEEITTATLIGRSFCNDFKEVTIERIYSAVANLLELYEGKLSLLQLGNIKARLRMIYLYNLASMHGGCVLDTSNKTEYELGFWTIHGDVGDINCGLINLWKTEVYELANCLFMSIPTSEPNKLKAVEESINLIPTDGNGVTDNGDCDQFGLDNYEQIDDVLKTMYFEAGMDSSKYTRLIDLYNEQGVDKIMTLHQNSNFKRKHLPIYPDISYLSQ